VHVEDDDALRLTVTVETADALHQPHRVPRQVVIDHDVAVALQVDALAARFGGDQELGRFLEAGDRLAPQWMGHGTVDLLHAARAETRLQRLLEVALGGAVFGEDQHLLVGIAGKDGFDQLIQKVLDLAVVGTQPFGLVDQLIQQIQLTVEKLFGLGLQLLLPLAEKALVRLVGIADDVFAGLVLQPRAPVDQGVVDRGNAGSGELAVDGHHKADGVALEPERRSGGVAFAEIVLQGPVERDGRLRDGDLQCLGGLAIEDEVAVCLGDIGLVVAKDHVADDLGVERQGGDLLLALGPQQIQQRLELGLHPPGGGWR
jgi:hypothetical protein